MIEQFLKQLRSVESDERRAAIVALVNLGDLSVLPHLAHVYRTDPDPALRELAVKAGRYLRSAAPSIPPAQHNSVVHTDPTPESPQESLWPTWAASGRASSRLTADERRDAGMDAHSTDDAEFDTAADQAEDWYPSWEQAQTVDMTASNQPSTTETEEEDEPTFDPIPVADTTLPPEGRVVSSGFVSKERQHVGEGFLAQAFNYRAANKPNRALAWLARALKSDPGLTANGSAQMLAADLMNMPPKQAMYAVLTKMDANDIHEEPENFLQLWIANINRRNFTIWLVELPLLYVVMVAFVIIYTYRLRVPAIVDSADTLDFILPRIVATLSGSQFGKALGLAFFSSLAVLFYIGCAYFAGTLRGGTGHMIRWFSIMTGVQVVTLMMLVMGLLFIPFVEFHPTGAPGQYYATIHLGAVFLGLLWVVPVQAYFAGRAHRVSIYTGAVFCFAGLAAAGALGNALGLFRASILG